MSAQRGSYCVYDAEEDHESAALLQATRTADELYAETGVLHHLAMPQYQYLIVKLAASIARFQQLF